MNTKGMVAVVEGLRDSGLAVTLMDARGRCTLMPRDTRVQTSRPELGVRQCIQVARIPPSQADMKPAVSRCEAGAQATDGQYTSTYRLTHCHAHPTSPTPELSEFPPQRAEVSPGQGHFEVGGSGSGETGRPSGHSCSYRGGLNYTDSGSVFSSRPSQQSDVFSSSLRRCPRAHQARSAELVQRLISYTQNKHLSRTESRCPSPPLRHSSISDHTRSLEPAINKRDIMDDDSMTASACGGTTRCNGTSRHSVNNQQNIKNTRRNTDSGHNDASRIRGRVDESPTRDGKSCSRKESPKGSISTNIHVQVGAEMVSREVWTSTAASPSRATVAVQVSRASSSPGLLSAGAPTTRETDTQSNDTICTSKHVQNSRERNTKYVAIKSVQAALSAIEIINSTHKFDHSVKDYVRKSKSQETISGSKRVQDEIFKWLQNVSICPNKDPNARALTNAVLKKLSIKFQKILQDKNSNEKELIMKVSKYLKHIPIWYPEKVFNRQVFRDELAKKLISTVKYTGVPITKANTSKPTYNISIMEYIIQRWVQAIPILTRDSYGKFINKDEVIKSFVTKVKRIIDSENKPNSNFVLKSNLVNILNETPLLINEDIHKFSYISDLADDLLQSIQIVLSPDTHINKVNSSCCHHSLNASNTSISIQINQIVRKELYNFLNEHKIDLNYEYCKEIETEILDIAMDYIDNINCDETVSTLREEMISYLTEIFSHDQAIVLTNQLMTCLYYNINRSLSKISNNFITTEQLVMYGNVSNDQSGFKVKSQIDNSDFSINEISNRDVDANIERYSQQLVEQINEWFNNLQLDITETQEKGFRQVVVNDLAGDIIDRYRYFELNPSSRRSDEEELNILKYQIFKCINKLIGEDNLETIAHAADLMRRLKSLPLPMFTKPKYLNSPSRSMSQAPHLQYSVRNSLDTTKNFPDSKQLHTGSVMSPRYWEPGIVTSTPVNNSIKDMNHLTMLPPGGPGGSMGNNSLTQINGNKQRLTQYQAPVISHPSTSKSMIAGLHEQKLNTRRFSGSTLFNRNPIITSDLYSTPPQNLPSCCRTAEQIHPVVEEAAPSCCKTNRTPLNQELTVEQIDDNFDKYLRQWVQEIPIKTNNPQEAELAAIARQGLRNGIWQMIIKIVATMPHAANNHFYFQDQLLEQLNDLLTELPQSPEYQDKKPELLTDLSEHLSQWLIDRQRVSPRYKNMLIQHAKQALEGRKITRDYECTESQLKEDLMIIKLAEDFLLWTKYEEEDKIKATAYKNRVLKEARQLVKNLKTKQENQKISDEDIEFNMSYLLTALHKVPQPTNETLNNEADEILMAMEVDHWFSDLPLPEIENDTERLARIRIRDALAKQLHEKEKDLSTADDSLAEREFKHEISKFLHKVPLARDESLNINFMVDELTNRLKNRMREKVSGQKRVVFHEPTAYTDFSKNVPLASSYIEIPQNLTQQNSIFNTGQPPASEFSMRIPNTYREFDNQRPISSTNNPPESGTEYYTLPNSNFIQNRNSRNFSPQGKTLPSQIERYIPGSFVNNVTSGKTWNIREESLMQPNQIIIDPRPQQGMYSSNYQGNKVPDPNSQGLNGGGQGLSIHSQNRMPTAAETNFSSLPSGIHRSTEGLVLEQGGTPINRESQEYLTGYFNPRPSAIPLAPPNLRIRNRREYERNELDYARRRLNLDREEEDHYESEEVYCRCMERSLRLGQRRCNCGEYDSVPFPYCYPMPPLPPYYFPFY